MNLTDKARRGSQEAMEALFDMTKNDVAYLCRLLLGDNQAASVAVPRIYRSLWEQVLAGRITTEEDFAQAALVKTAAFCKTVLAKKDSKSFRIPQNRDFVLGMGEGRLSLQGEPWELAVDNLPPLHRFLYVLPVLCGYTQAQLAKLFHTNEETVRLAQVAEAICLKRLFAALSRLLGREISLTQEEFHRALEANRPRAEVPPTVDSAVLHAIRAVCRPIQRRLAKKRKRVALAAGTVVVLACLTGALCTPLWPGTGERLRKAPHLSPPRWRSSAPRRLPAKPPPRPRRAPPFPKAPLFPRTPAPPKPPLWTAKPPNRDGKASLRAGLFAQKNT